MYTSFPHPNDKLIILRVDGPLSEADRTEIAKDVESRVRQYGETSVLLEFHGVAPVESKLLWSDRTTRLVVRLAVIRGEGTHQWAQPLTGNFESDQRAFFVPSEREQALDWVQGGKVPNHDQ
mgnify:CR=1 FL=1